MIVSADAKSLEWVVGSYLSRDKLAYEEIFAGVDVHRSNQIRFKLPGWQDAQDGVASEEAALGRLVAKIFVFRLMYGGSAYSYANDPDFTVVSTSEKYWQGIIEAFYDKYKDFAAWHIKIVQEVTTTGQLAMPTGRIYTFERNSRGDWPITTIKNYPVQGLGADIMSIARVSFNRRFKEAKIKGLQINTVHDSIIVDTPEEYVDQTAQIFHDVFRDLPENFERVFKHKFDLPLRAEVSFGPNMWDVITWTEKNTQKSTI